MGDQQAFLRKNAETLIRLNQAVLEAAGAMEQDGRYTLSARIVERNGNRVIVIDRLEAEDAATDRSAAVPQDGVLDPYGDSTGYIRYGPLPQQEHLSPPQPGSMPPANIPAKKKSEDADDEPRRDP